MKKDNKCLIGMELRETERNYVTMLSNIIRVRFLFIHSDPSIQHQNIINTKIQFYPTIESDVVQF